MAVSSSGASAGGPVTPEQLVSQLAAALCQRRITCGRTLEAQRQACVSNYVETFAGYVTNPLAIGAVTWQPAAAQACLNWFNSFPNDCGHTSSFDLLGTLCSPGLVVPDAAGLGQTCKGSYNCTAGYCSGQGNTCGTCTPFRALGADCTDDYNSCDDSASCDFNSVSNRNECTALLADGQPCTYSFDCVSFQCNPDVNSMLHCGPTALGALCTEATCGRDRYCGRVPGGPTNETRCQAEVATGSPCGTALWPEEDDACSDPLAHCVAGTCAVIPVNSVPQNGACGTDSDCAAGLYCRMDANGAGTCVPPVPLQGTCDAYNSCAANGRCNNGTCVARSGAGDDCASDADCYSDMRCNSASKCEGYVGLGEPCGPTALCRGTFCGTSGRCEARKAIGAACTTDLECVTDRCPASDGGPRVCTGCY